MRTPNGVRYPLVGGTGQRHFNGINSKPRKLLENAQTPTTMAPAHFAGDRVHIIPVLVRDAVLARSPKMAESVTALSPWKPIHSE